MTGPSSLPPLAAWCPYYDDGCRCIPSRSGTSGRFHGCRGKSVYSTQINEIRCVDLTWQETSLTRFFLRAFHDHKSDTWDFPTDFLHLSYFILYNHFIILYTSLEIKHFWILLSSNLSSPLTSPLPFSHLSPLSTLSTPPRLSSFLRLAPWMVDSVSIVDSFLLKAERTRMLLMLLRVLKKRRKVKIEPLLIIGLHSL